MIQERTAKVVKEWDYKGKKLVIVLMEWNVKVKAISPSLVDFYNGYVETTLRKKYSSLLDIDVHGGITFGASKLLIDNLSKELKDMKFYGFDTSHHMDGGITHRKMDFMIKETEKLAEQIIKLEGKRK